ncbi:hypothetical protein CERSUDRAFT_100864 [Gelatoporia subvermispora B]|uniref:Carbamoyl-phosphate synthetase large subunit oligomerisation domain-containing protein n=1 Tax=Ceriporiopsis subvermispora (strain B) TaxID=914234 RepID=M2Q2D7_CERS8|nr:hypothetical protein CERSUDRAFT_100864 [Gelatoporia subvermispora B]
MKGWEEIEYEVEVSPKLVFFIANISSLQNFDPLGIHTGESIAIAPSQSSSLPVLALASKATSYPLACIAAKLGLNIPLNEIKNSVTKVTSARFEPSLGYVVVKIPRWDLKKFSRVSRLLSSSLKSVGEVMSIGRTIPETRIPEGQSLDRRPIPWLREELAVRRPRQEVGISPFVKQIDTAAAEFPVFTNYIYMTYNAAKHHIKFHNRGVVFDWCAVRAIGTLREKGLPTVMVNYNPETVSTDYDEVDRLYFENICLETILGIYEAESSRGAILSMGGQTPTNIALSLYCQNVKIYGTCPEMIDTAEDRSKLSRLSDEIGVDQPQWKELSSFDEARAFCDKSGRSLELPVASSRCSRDHPVVITKYIEGAKETEMDAVAQGGKMIVHYISEHVENAGIHSGDATLIHPPQDLDPRPPDRSRRLPRRLATR